MSTTTPVLPPFGRMNLNAILFEAMLYGINIVVFSATMYVLRRKMKSASMLLTCMSLYLMSLSTAHFTISWIQLVQAYTDAPNNQSPLGPDLFFAALGAPLATVNSVIYVLNIMGNNLLLILRLYMVLGRSWKIIIGPLIFEAVHISCALTSIGLLAAPGADLFSPVIQAWGKAAWSLDLALNTTLTVIIGFSLWRAGQNTASLTRSGKNKYTETVLTIVESGAVYAIATLIIFVLDIVGLPAGFVGITGIIQLATTTPLLIIVRVGLGLTRDNHTTLANTAPVAFGSSRSGVHVNISRVVDSQSDVYAMKGVGQGDVESNGKAY